MTFFAELNRRKVIRIAGLQLVRRKSGNSDDVCNPSPGGAHTILIAGVGHGELSAMITARKITVEVPAELLAQAQRASGVGVTQTIRAGLKLVAAAQAYAGLRQLRGKVRFAKSAAEHKSDR